MTIIEEGVSICRIHPLQFIGLPARLYISLNNSARSNENPGIISVVTISPDTNARIGTY